MYTIEQLKDFLYRWLKQGKFANYYDLEKFTQVIHDKSINIKLYTDKNVYSIVATSEGYLGCIVNSRKQKAGEDWHRGNDLADGKLNDKTMINILLDIVSYELTNE